MLGLIDRRRNFNSQGVAIHLGRRGKIGNGNGNVVQTPDHRTTLLSFHFIGERYITANNTEHTGFSPQASFTAPRTPRPPASHTTPRPSPPPPPTPPPLP